MAERGELLERYVVWLSAGIGVSVVTLLWRPLVADASWYEVIGRGELMLVALGVTASAVGYGGGTSPPKGSRLAVLRTLVLWPGILFLLLCAGMYIGISANLDDPSVAKRLSEGSIAVRSYFVLATSVVFGSAATYLVHASEPLRVHVEGQSPVPIERRSDHP